MNNLVSINELENSLLAKRASIQSTKGFPKPEKKDGIDFYKKKDVEKFINSELILWMGKSNSYLPFHLLIFLYKRYRFEIIMMLRKIIVLIIFSFCFCFK